MSNITVAIPCKGNGGLDAHVDAHFGHCEGYTLVEVEDGKAGAWKTLPSIPHVQGGCMGPVNYLADNGVNVLISGGMGMRPLMGFDQVGIAVFHGGDSQTVGQAVEAFAQGRLARFSPAQTCGGGEADHVCGGH
jgi:predicted Fe-Mo cluster-binding NifX family protein